MQKSMLKKIERPLVVKCSTRLGGVSRGWDYTGLYFKTAKEAKKRLQSFDSSIAFLDGAYLENGRYDMNIPIPVPPRWEQ